MARTEHECGCVVRDDGTWSYCPQHGRDLEEQQAVNEYYEGIADAYMDFPPHPENGPDLLGTDY